MKVLWDILHFEVTRVYIHEGNNYSTVITKSKDRVQSLCDDRKCQQSDLRNHMTFQKREEVKNNEQETMGNQNSGP